MKKLPPPYRIQINYTKPPSLDTLLDEFKEKIADMPSEIELWEKISNVKKGIDQDQLYLHIDIPAYIKLCPHDSKEKYQQEFIEQMGMALHCHENNHHDAAWFHYAWAQYFLGMYDAWDRAFEDLHSQDTAQLNRSEGGKSKNWERRNALLAELINVASKQKPPNGWKSKQELFKKAEYILIKINDAHPKPFTDLERMVYKWLNTDADALRAYGTNCALNNKDGDFFQDNQP